MNTAKIFLFFVVLIGALSGFFASRARINHVIYTPDPINTSICNMALTGRSIIPTAQGTYYATALFGYSCVPVMTMDLMN